MIRSRRGTPGPERSGLSAARGNGGYTIIEILITVAVIAIVAAIAFPVYTKFIQRARETAVISYLSSIKRAETIYMAENLLGLYSGDFEDLETTGALPAGSGNATRVMHDYRFDLVSGVSGGVPYWRVNAAPVDSSATARWFYVDETGIIRFETGLAAGAGSPPLNG